MPVIGFHAQHEQAHPRDLRDSAVHAEQAGFDAVMCSDHLAPWSRSQGHSGLTWAWLGAALQATERVPMGCFHAPGQRYHPVISAQAFATLAAMFPGRLPWIAVGSGEALNEHVTGDPWPTKDVRMARLRECVDVMRRAVARRGGLPPRAGHRRPGPGVVAAGRAAEAGRRGDQRGDRRLGRRSGPTG